ncbi:hypothetical protein H8E77_01500 [bacterium]|nr:hypothetical protein [bacterium]
MAELAIKGDMPILGAYNAATLAMASLSNRKQCHLTIILLHRRKRHMIGIPTHFRLRQIQKKPQHP